MALSLVNRLDECDSPCCALCKYGMPRRPPPDLIPPQRGECTDAEEYPGNWYVACCIEPTTNLFPQGHFCFRFRSSNDSVDFAYCILDLPITGSAIRALVNRGYKTWYDVIQHGRRRVSRVCGVGKKSMKKLDDLFDHPPYRTIWRP